MEQINNAIKQLGNNFIDIIVKEYNLNKTDLEKHFQTALGYECAKTNVKTEPSLDECMAGLTIEEKKTEMPKTETIKRTRARTPYMCFAMKQRVIEKTSGKHQASEITKVVADMWKTMSADEKAPFVAESKNDAKDFKMTGKNKTKRPPNAYVLWQTEVRAQYKQNHPKLSFGELTKLISTDWKKMSHADKTPYLKKVAAMKSGASSSDDEEKVVEEKVVEEKVVEEKVVEEKVVEDKVVEEKVVEEKVVDDSEPEIISSTYGTAEDSFLRRLVELRALTDVDVDSRMSMIKALEADDADVDSDLSSDNE